MFKEDNSLLRHKAGHDAHVRDVMEENITTAMCGVKSDCPFNELGYWHVTSNLVVDAMHDLLEGISLERCILHYNIPGLYGNLGLQLDEGIDEESFFLLDDDTLKSLIPKAGPRLKFKKYLNSFIESSNFSALPTFDSPAPPCNSFSNSVTDSLTIFPHPVCNISDDSHANSDSANNESSIHDISLNYSDPLSSSTPLPLLSPLSTSSRKKINIRETVKLKLPYIFAKLEKGDPTNVSILHKYRINRLLVQTYVEEYDCRPSTKNKLDLAKDIVNAFPVLKGSDGEGHEQWFSPGVRGAPATGFIADRFKNFRSRNLSVVEKEELGIGRICKKTNAKPEKYPGTEDSSVEFFQKQQWLKENESPLEKVIQLMQETFEGRRFEIMRNATNFVSNWPRILDPHVKYAVLLSCCFRKASSGEMGQRN
ncbi:hypothetical protein TNCT_640371 [Trichonephila clavata]|uniref:Uncharacterized protein n=1 Tax=Trichonephila clavata TaxID=2740835 RepID=A0A8X6L448_TRICU|nr:hypothetical protein TNCT_640371 [Trichonephila clavata]